jgi:hypothetical protein
MRGAAIALLIAGFDPIDLDQMPVGGFPQTGGHQQDGKSMKSIFLALTVLLVVSAFFIGDVAAAFTRM